MRNISIFKLSCFFLPILIATPFALADLADDMDGAEKLYEAGNYVQAEQNFQNIINNADPNKPEELELAFQARRKLPLIYLATDQRDQAQVSMEQLLTKHPTHERLPHSIHGIVEQAKELGKTLQAGQVYQNILEAQPKHPQAIWLKMGIAITNAHLGNDQAVDSALQNIIAQHADDDRAAEALGQTAWAYRKLNQHEKARKVYQYVVDNWPDKDRAIFSQRGIILSSLKLGDQDAADAAAEQLVQNFSEDKNIAKVLWTVADVYKDKKDWERMRPLCEYILANHSSDEDAIWAQQALIFACIDQQDVAGIDSGIQELFAKFTTHKGMPSAAYGTARKLNRINDATAQQLYQYVVDKHPDHEYIPFARVNLGQIKLRLGDEQGAEAIFQKVLTDYKDHPRLAEAAHLMAEGYWYKAFAEPRQNHQMTENAKESLQKALAKWELIITQFPVVPYTTANAHYLAGACCYRLGQYEKAIEYFQKTVDSFPDYEKAWLAQNRIVKVYKFMIRDGIIPEREGEAAMTAAYQKLITNFPDCPIAGRASKWLEIYAISTEGGQ